ncbi:MAG: hypothetical protein IJ833_06550 [Lachnospiraceae bacterium]|nr:hypothetical protein [Lachnospiraceae bacterium]
MSIQVTSPTGMYGSYEQTSINRTKEKDAAQVTEEKEQKVYCLTFITNPRRQRLRSRFIGFAI